jgi:hypothetical protein
MEKARGWIDHWQLNPEKESKQKSDEHVWVGAWGGG